VSLNRSSKPDQAHREIEPPGEHIKCSRFRVVDAAKAVGLHQSVPNAPEENNQQDAFEVPPKECDTRYQQKQRREDEAPFEAVEQCPITVGANHSRQVMTHRAEGSHEKINVLRTPPRLGQSKRRYEQ